MGLRGGRGRKKHLSVHDSKEPKGEMRMAERGWFWMAGTILSKGLEDYWSSVKLSFPRCINKVKATNVSVSLLRMHQDDGGNNSSFIQA